MLSWLSRFRRKQSLAEQLEEAKEIILRLMDETDYRDNLRESQRSHPDPEVNAYFQQQAETVRRIKSLLDIAETQE